MKGEVQRMRVVVTGASGEFGSSIIPFLLRRGYDVEGVSRSPHTLPHPGYHHTPADVRDPDALAKAMKGADAVVHLAWTTHPMKDVAMTRSIDVGGTEAVLEAMKAEGVPRLVFASSVMAYGANPDNPKRFAEGMPLRPNPDQVYQVHKVEAEQAIARSGVDALMIRATNIMDRHCTGVTQQGFAGPAILGFKGASNTMQFIHGDDLGRFYADAVARTDWTGPVNLAAQDVVPMAELAQILGRRYVEIDLTRAQKVVGWLWDRGRFQFDPGALGALAYFPLVDTSRLREEFGWQPAWSARECAEDFAGWNREHVFLGPKRLEIPWRWPIGKVPGPDRTEARRHPAGPEKARGELDTLVDEDWSLFTAANTAEAFPGPMTPLSVELSAESMSAAGQQCADVLRLDGELRRVLTHEQVGTFGHGIYANMSVILAMGKALPGGDAQSWEDMLFGGTDFSDVPELEPVSPLGMLARLPWLVAKGASLDRETRLIADRARASSRSAEEFAAMDDARLRAELQRTRDRVANAWSTAAQGAVFITAVMGLIEKQAGRSFASQIRGGADGLASAGAALGVHQLATMARKDAAVAAVLGELPPAEALATIRREHPSFAAKLDRIIADYGHRGPRETELANRMFADDPARLVDAVAKLVAAGERAVAPAPAMGWRLRKLAGIGSHFQQARERVRDVAMRETHQYRLIARELGQRMAAAGLVDAAADVWFMRRDELIDPPADARERVARRRADHERLLSNRPPISFNGDFEPVSTQDVELAPGQSLTGVAVSAGAVTGVVRVVTLETIDDLEPGEIIVAEFTDVGWTPFFSFAGAVVVDTGGEMSHAAVVAREFGIPCVVATRNGSKVLKDGHVVEVDGANGTITRVE